MWEWTCTEYHIFPLTYEGKDQHAKNLEAFKNQNDPCHCVVKES